MEKLFRGPTSPNLKLSPQSIRAFMKQNKAKKDQTKLLHAASFTGNFEAVQALLECGVEILSKDPEKERTAVHWAASNLNIFVALYLARHSSLKKTTPQNILYELKDKDGQSAMDLFTSSSLCLVSFMFPSIYEPPLLENTVTKLKSEEIADIEDEVTENRTAEVYNIKEQKHEVYSWGDCSNANYLLGHSFVSSNARVSPKRINALSDKDIIEVSCSDTQCAVIGEDGSLYSWGFGKGGKLGHGNEDNLLEPMLVSYFSPSDINNLQSIRVTKISVSSVHSVCIVEDGSLFTWGGNEHGQLGHGDYINILSPKKVKYFDSRNKAIVDISTGKKHTVVLTSGGSVYSFGDNTYLQLGYDCSMHKAPTNKNSPEKSSTISENRSSIPRVIASTKAQSIKLIGCGVTCTVVVSQNEDVHVFGLCKYNYGKKIHFPGKKPVIRSISVQSTVSTLSNTVNTPLERIAVVTDDGIVYTWIGDGKIKNNVDDISRIQLRNFRKIKKSNVVELNKLILLSEDGLVFQCDIHSSDSHECRKVKSIKDVTQLACTKDLFFTISKSWKINLQDVTVLSTLSDDTISASLRLFVNSSQYSDFSFIIIENEKTKRCLHRIHAHKLVLAARSPYFRDLFTLQDHVKEFEILAESTHEADVLKDSLLTVLRYLYTGTGQQSFSSMGTDLKRILSLFQLNDPRKTSCSQLHQDMKAVVPTVNNRLAIPVSNYDILIEIPNQENGDAKLRAHKLILTTRSEYFRMMIGSGMHESFENKVKLGDQFSPLVIELLLFAMYSDIIPLKSFHCSFEHIAQLLLASEYFMVSDSIKHSISAILVDFICLENISSFFEMLSSCPTQNSNQTLRNEIYAYILQNLDSCVEYGIFDTFPSILLNEFDAFLKVKKNMLLPLPVQTPVETELESTADSHCPTNVTEAKDPLKVTRKTKKFERSQSLSEQKHPHGIASQLPLPKDNFVTRASEEVQKSSFSTSIEVPISKEKEERVSKAWSSPSISSSKNSVKELLLQEQEAKKPPVKKSPSKPQTKSSPIPIAEAKKRLSVEPSSPSQSPSWKTPQASVTPMKNIISLKDIQNEQNEAKKSVHAKPVAEIMEQEIKESQKLKELNLIYQLYGDEIAVQYATLLWSEEKT